MEKVYIVYWSGSGNTETMAQAVAEGVKEAGKEAVLLTPSEANVEDLKAVPAFAMGCPAMGDEVLEEDEMEPFVASVEGIVAGKQLALFGSYGWGDGQWMRDWTERMTSAGASVITGEGVICLQEPDEDTTSQLKAVGKQLAEI